MLWSKAIGAGGAGGAGGVVEGWNVSTAVFNQSFSFAAQETAPFSVFFKPDGLKMYVMGTDQDRVSEYNLSAAWDVSTAVHLQNFSVSSQDAVPFGMFFKPDGTKMYITGTIGDNVYEYNLSAAWNVSTAVFNQSFSVAAQETSPTAVFFKPDGLKMYFTGFTFDRVSEYNLSTAWDVSTAVHLQNLNVGAQETGPAGLFFKPDGLKMYVSGFGGLDVNEYNLSAAWDVSTAVHLQNFSVSAQDTSPRGLFLKPDGLKMYITGQVGDKVYEYDLTA